MKYTKTINIETTFTELLDSCNDIDINSQEIIKELSDKFESYEFDIKLLHSILDIINSCSPSKEDLKDLDIDKIRKLLEVFGIATIGDMNIINVSKDE